MKYPLLTLVLGLGFTDCLGGTAVQTDPDNSMMSDSAQLVQAALASTDAAVQRAAVSSIAAWRTRTIRDTISVVRDSIRRGDSATVKAGITVLGELRAEEAVPLLVEHLTIILPPPPNTALAKGVFPIEEGLFVRALLQIGWPALDPLVKAVQSSDDQRRMFLTAFVLARTLGPDLAVAFVDEHRQGAGEAESERLLRLQELIDTDVRKLRAIREARDHSSR